MQSVSYNFELFKKPQYIKEPFNRHCFDPENNIDHDFTLDKLRQVGFRRACAVRQAMESGFKDYLSWDGQRNVLGEVIWDRYHLLRSHAADDANIYLLRNSWNVKGMTFVDFGAGKSPDSAIAKMQGFKNSYAVDLFPAESYVREKNKVVNIKSDICERLPLKSRSVNVVICQAVLPLMNKSDRDLVYKEAHRLLKKGGIFSALFCKLACGHDYNLPEERLKAMRFGFNHVGGSANSFVLTKI